MIVNFFMLMSRLLGLLFLNFILIPVLCLCLLGSQWINQAKARILHKKFFDLCMWVLSLCVCGIRGVRIHQHLSSNMPAGPVVVICNHQSGMDVWLLMILMHQCYGDFRFILKDSLKWFPGFGWYSYLMGYPFTRRARISELKADKRLRGVEKAAIIEAINRDKNNPLAWCCFPEGTRLNKGRSNGSFRHVQEPKIGSFLQYIQALDYNVKVIDVTIAYRIQPCSILRLLYEPKHMGDIWLDVVDINANMDRKGLRELLLNLWNKKDARLSRYEKKERVDVG